MKTAIVHEWMCDYAGSERVVEQFLQCLPEAELYAVCDFLDDQERAFLGGRKPHTTFVQSLPFARKKYRWYLPLMPLAIEQFDLSAYDTIVTSNHAVAKGVITGPDQLHLSYLHTPIRYAWDLQHQYLRESRLDRGLRGLIARTMLHYMRMWDVTSSRRVDVLLANSHYVGRRIWKYYGRKAKVLYPPVDVEKFPLETQKDDYYVTMSRMVPYKRVDIIVKAFEHLPNRKLVVIGDGPDFKKIQAVCPPNVELLGYQTDGPARERMQRAKAFVFAAEEDFGIAPVEAQACGTPCIAFGRGGAVETVVPGMTGVLFPEQTPQSIADAVREFETLSGQFDPERIRQHAEKFSIATFRRRFLRILQWAQERHQKRLARGTPKRPVESFAKS
jgi:glycosyltransferase involved in cell wall biosynthesis